MPRGIPPIQRGDLITADRLNDYGDGINELNELEVDPPRANDDPGPNQAEGEQQDPSIFVEQSRTTSLVQVFDDEDENYAEVERIDLVTFVDGNGKELKLQFNN